MTEYKSKISEYIAGKISPEEFLSYLENTPELFDKLEKLTLEAGITQKARKQVPLDFFFTELSDEAKNSINSARYALISASKETQTAYAKDLLLLLRKLNFEKGFLPATLSMQLDLYHSNIDAPNYAEMLPDFMRGIFDTTHFIEEELPYNVRGITENRSRTLAWHYAEIQTRFAFLMSALFPDESFPRDEKLREKASFSDDVRPDYIGGGDLDTERIIGGIIDKIIAELPDNMPLAKRKKAIKEKIKYGINTNNRVFLTLATEYNKKVISKPIKVPSQNCIVTRLKSISDCNLRKLVISIKNTLKFISLKKSRTVASALKIKKEYKNLDIWS